MAWVKVGDLQKGKIFTVISGESFDLLWYSDNVGWRNPVVIGQVSSIYFDRLFTAGFKAIIQHNGGTSYTAFAQSSGVINTSGGDISGWTQNIVQQGGDGGAYGGTVHYPNQTRSWGHVNDFRGFWFSTYIRPNDYMTNWYENQMSGTYVVTVAGMEIVSRDIRLGNGNATTYTWTPMFSGEVVFHYRVSNSPSTGRLHLYAYPFTSTWENKSGIITIYANDTQGVGY